VTGQISSNKNKLNSLKSETRKAKCGDGDAGRPDSLALFALSYLGEHAFSAKDEARDDGRM
jgi:hypothetical protein